jgi:broad specificity phosphatase PhoE
MIVSLRLLVIHLLLLRRVVFAWHYKQPTVLRMTVDVAAASEELPTSTSSLARKKLLCVRHGISVANEFMRQPGNQWGEPTFRDDGKMDAPLSKAGRQKTQEVLPQQLQTEFSDFLDEVELVIISPLTRCLETYQYGAETELKHHIKNKGIPVLAVPLLCERVYTASDTGRPASTLTEEFPGVDFSECPSNADTKQWWYSDQYPESEEWRPHGQGQSYAVPGEPKEVFEKRMEHLDEWIWNRPERNILMVAHWGVLRHLTSGTEWQNAEAKMLEWSFCSIRNSTVVAHV